MAAKDKTEKCKKILNKLQIPFLTSMFGGIEVDGEILVDMLTDEEECKKLISMLKNKAFW